MQEDIKELRKFLRNPQALQNSLMDRAREYEDLAKTQTDPALEAVCYGNARALVQETLDRNLIFDDRHRVFERLMLQEALACERAAKKQLRPEKYGWWLIQAASILYDSTTYTFEPDNKEMNLDIFTQAARLWNCVGNRLFVIASRLDPTRETLFKIDGAVQGYVNAAEASIEASKHTNLRRGEIVFNDFDREAMLSFDQGICALNMACNSFDQLSALTPLKEKIAELQRRQYFCIRDFGDRDRVEEKKRIAYQSHLRVAGQYARLSKLLEITSNEMQKKYQAYRRSQVINLLHAAKLAPTTKESFEAISLAKETNESDLGAPCSDPKVPQHPCSREEVAFFLSGPLNKAKTLTDEVNQYFEYYKKLQEEGSVNRN